MAFVEGALKAHRITQQGFTVLKGYSYIYALGETNQMLTADQTRIYNWYKQSAQVLKSRAENGDGTLSSQEMGNYRYFDYPYLLLERDREIAERMSDVMSNTVDISEDGRICASDETRLAKHDELYWGLLSEINMRQLHQTAFSPWQKQVEKYLISTIGVDMFKKAGNVEPNAIIKFSEAQYVDRMIEKGEFRIAPAKYYKDDAPEDAMRGDETNRLYKVKALLDVLDGELTVDIQRNVIPIKNGFIELTTPIDNYYMFCSCTYFSRRMPIDFNADAALIIDDREEFVKRMNEAVSKQLPDFEFIADEVSYYDPYNDVPNLTTPEFMKHFSYAYQKEHRCIWRSMSQLNPEQLEPIFVSLGPLDDIARPVYA